MQSWKTLVSYNSARKYLFPCFFVMLRKTASWEYEELQESCVLKLKNKLRDKFFDILEDQGIDTIELVDKRVETDTRLELENESTNQFKNFLKRLL